MAQYEVYRTTSTDYFNLHDEPPKPAPAPPKPAPVPTGKYWYWALSVNINNTTIVFMLNYDRIQSNGIENSGVSLS